MVYKHYILTTVRLMMGKWWFGLIKVFSLTSGILSFLLIWFFYLEQGECLDQEKKLMQSCSLENIMILGFILLLTSIIYFLVMKSQITTRQKELFWRKYYGESSNGIAFMLMLETAIFILIAFVLSLVLVDLITPFFNFITSKNISLRHQGSLFNLTLIVLFLSLLGVTIGILPSIWYGRTRASDILKNLSL